MAIILLLLTKISFAQSNAFIHWSEERKLTWTDFKAAPEASSNNAAITNTNIRFNVSMKNDSIRFEVQCVFDPSKSWGKLKTPYILLHEQSHFDIAEIHARILHKKLSGYKWVASQAEKEINGIFEEVMNNMLEMQNEYDFETDYSRNKTKQELWNNKIVALLENWKEYKNYRLFSGK